MFCLVENRRWYFLLSALIIIPGLVAMIYSTITTGLPFKLAIDFTGGSIWSSLASCGQCWRRLGRVIPRLPRWEMCRHCRCG
jgi:hypothetical protein